LGAAFRPRQVLRGEIDLHRGIAKLQRDSVALHRGVVPACRQAGTDKKKCKSFILSLP